MKKYKICVYAICKNEEKFARRWMESMSEADAVAVTDTGSSDNTVQLLRECGAAVFEARVEPWRFDTARNLALSHVPKDADICVCTDLDEVFTDGWRQALETAWEASELTEPEPAARLGKYLFNFGMKPDGTSAMRFYNSKIHTRDGFQWIYPIHEIMDYTGELPLKTVTVEGMTLSHYPDADKSRAQYLSLLEEAVLESPRDPRMRYYLGREYMYQNRLHECIAAFFEHLRLSRWDEERCSSMRSIAEALHRLGDVSAAYSWYYRAIAEAPHIREPYIEFARMAYLREDWTAVFFLTEKALSIKTPSRAYISMDYAWDETPYQMNAVARVALLRSTVGASES